MKAKVSRLLLKCGVEPHLLGYDYLGEAIEMVLEDKDAIRQVTKIIYPRIARKYSTLPGRVERAIRHAVERAFFNMSAETIYEIFGNTMSYDSGKVTNSHFIAAVAEAYRREE